MIVKRKKHDKACGKLYCIISLQIFSHGPNHLLYIRNKVYWSVSVESSTNKPYLLSIEHHFMLL